MTVKSLEPLAASKYQTLPLSTLKDATLGIEAEYYLWRLLNTPPTKEPLLSALGGFPYGLKQAIEDDLAAFQAAGIKPLFVFNGLKIARTEKPFLAPDHGPASRLKAWDMYDKGLAAQSVEAFGDAIALKPEELYRYVQAILRENNVEFFVAPYSAWPQSIVVIL
ncbi:PIN domain-like protein [Kalaharituber pfeilii]|nr:PIN domain-like protein [Kalaharituber pfeilii]